MNEILKIGLDESRIEFLKEIANKGYSTRNLPQELEQNGYIELYKFYKEKEVDIITLAGAVERIVIYLREDDSDFRLIGSIRLDMMFYQYQEYSVGKLKEIIHEEHDVLPIIEKLESFKCLELNLPTKIINAKKVKI